MQGDGTVPPPMIGPYRLEGLIGSGALGDVHRAFDPRVGRAAALKLLRVGAAGAEAERRFAAESAAARRLEHPGIVRVYDAGVDAGRPWIAMELLNGCDLQRYTRPARLLPEAVVARIGRRLAEALAHAHRHGIVHRDVKPSNVIVDWAGDRLTLTDFGTAHLADGERTATGVVLGSPAYMAPEQLAGAPAAPSGDLYALGVLLFELLAGRRPHDGSSMGDLLRRVATEDAPPLAALRPGVPADLAALVAALLAKSSAGRPDDAAEVASSLARIADALPPTHAGPKSRA